MRTADRVTCPLKIPTCGCVSGSPRAWGRGWNVGPWGPGDHELTRRVRVRRYWAVTLAVVLGTGFGIAKVLGVL